MMEDVLRLVSTQPKEVFRLATVKSTTISGTIRVQFDGETEPSDKAYAYLKSMGRPEAGERVLMAAVGGTYIAIGTVTRGYMPYGVPMAQKLAAERTIELSGDAVGSVNFDGSKSVTLPVNVLYAAAVDNTAGYTGGIYFRANYANRLEFRVGTGNSRYTLANA